MAKYKAYPEYKESGVKWLDKLPLKWSTEKQKNVFLKETWLDIYQVRFSFFH